MIEEFQSVGAKLINATGGENRATREGRMQEASFATAGPLLRFRLEVAESRGPQTNLPLRLIKLSVPTSTRRLHPTPKRLEREEQVVVPIESLCKQLLPSFGIVGAQPASQRWLRALSRQHLGEDHLSRSNASLASRCSSVCRARRMPSPAGSVRPSSRRPTRPRAACESPVSSSSLNRFPRRSPRRDAPHQVLISFYHSQKQMPQANQPLHLPELQPSLLLARLLPIARTRRLHWIVRSAVAQGGFECRAGGRRRREEEDAGPAAAV